MTMTNLAICVYVSYLQRHAKAPCFRHLRDLNRLVKWIKLHPQTLKYTRLEPPTKLVCVTDSSFSAGDTEGLVMRGCILLLVEDRAPASPCGKVQVVDWFARKQPHVCRSTFAAELHASLDGLNQGLIVQTAVHEVAHGVAKPSELLDLRQQAKLRPALEACLDARSVFDAVTASTVKVPADKHLFLHVLKLREFLDTGQLRRLWWIDTRMMLADGLTKGAVERDALTSASEGIWTQSGLSPVCYPG